MNKLIKNTSLYTLGNIIPQIAGFILLPLYTKYLSPTAYGIVNSLQVLTGLLAVFFTLAVDRAVYRLYFDHKTEKSKKDYLGTITISLFFISTIILILIFLFKNPIGQIYKSIQFYPYYLYAILTAFFAVYSIIPKIYFQLNGKAGMFIMLSIGQFLLNTGFTIWYVIEKNQGAEGMLKAGMIANICITPLVAYISYKTINFSFKIDLLKDSLGFSIPMIPALLTSWILNISDRIFIERYFTLADVGVYSLGYKIAGLVSLFTAAFNQAFAPVFYKLANSEDQINAKKQLYKYSNTYILVILLISFFIAFFSKEVILLMFNIKFQEAYKIIPIITLAFLISQISGLFNLMIYQKKKVILLTFVGLISAGVNILLNFILIPVFGSYGAAYSTLISFFVMFLVSWKFATGCYYIPFDWKKLFIVFFPFLICVIVFQYIVSVNLYVSLLVKFIICGLIVTLVFKKYSIEFKQIFLRK